MDQVKTIVETLAQEEGVNLAMVVSRDGFILEMQSAQKLAFEPETLGAAVSTYWNMADGMGKELTAEDGLNSVVEFRNATVATALIEEEDLLLTVVADKKANPAMIRYLTSKFTHLLVRSL
jgi:predicted regulator of Ras-like GTPase activity (Roadblock/LC7/MglB family)